MIISSWNRQVTLTAAIFKRETTNKENMVACKLDKDAEDTDEHNDY